MRRGALCGGRGFASFGYRDGDTPDQNRLCAACLLALAGVAGCDGRIVTSNDGGFARDGSADAAADVTHRAAPTPCSSDPPAPGDVNLDAGALVPDPMNPYADAGVPPDCHNDKECDAGMNGRCRWTYEVFSSDGGGQPLPKCTYDRCFSDQDCPSPLVCDCRGAPVYNLWPSNQCLPSGDCRVDSDCASGLCSPSSNNGCALGFFCHSALDKCTSDGDCPYGQRCSIPMGDVWQCLMGCFDAGSN